MKYLAAYLLLQKAGKENPTAEEITSLLESVGADVEQDKITLLLSSIKGKAVDELIAQGAQKLSALPAGGAATTGGAASKEGSAAAGDEDKEDESAEEEESDDDMGMGLFD
ncbi:hypothetical protein FOA43_002575 [Brettanomyces nanus]|uniref:60S acidic ribosomal protein P2 n=1 Tax=Eeniella nana TaxID=13502 RepID=A0A875S4C8_EENNA|nr:uncharacterized protein FOA43_002575 [Brettanomyces nanus]QPG75225.1 hypothetical protein FOA43_002575 [Brettanomyces nanus]